MNSKFNIINSITPGVTNFPVSDLIWDQFIYPRGGKSEKTIDAYVEALAIGAQFPPIKIQRVFNYPSSPPPLVKRGRGDFRIKQPTCLPVGMERL